MSSATLEPSGTDQRTSLLTSSPVPPACRVRLVDPVNQVHPVHVRHLSLRSAIRPIVSSRVYKTRLPRRNANLACG